MVLYEDVFVFVQEDGIGAGEEEMEDEEEGWSRDDVRRVCNTGVLVFSDEEDDDG
jgi:hypothetical protein